MRLSISPPLTRKAPIVPLLLMIGCFFPSHSFALAKNTTNNIEEPPKTEQLITSSNYKLEDDEEPTEINPDEDRPRNTDSEAPDEFEGTAYSESIWDVSINPIHNTTEVDCTFLGALDVIDEELADAVTVTATMTYRGKTTRRVVGSASLNDLLGNNLTLRIDLKDFGKFSVKVAFTKDGTDVHENAATTVAVTADAYNIAPISASLPVTFFSLNMWGENNIRTVGPTILMFERPNAYNWDNLPAANNGVYGVYGVPYLSQTDLRKQPADFNDAGSQFRSREQLVADYVHDLMELDPSSHVNLYCVDLFCGLAQSIIYANKIPSAQYTITLLSDGSFTPSQFKQTYNQSNNNARNEQLKKEWIAAKEGAYKTGKADNRFKGSGGYRHFWALVDTEENAQLWVARKDLIQSTGDSDSFGESVRNSSKLVQQNIGTLLAQNIQSSDTAMSEFKALYNFSDSYFSEAQANGKQVMLLLGQRANSEQSFTDYARFVMGYYGDAYQYYYKGHPATPTDLYPDKANQLAQLGITDVDASIAAELILFFNPNIYLSGYSSSVYASVPQGMAKGMFNMTKAYGLTQNDYKNMDYWMSPVTKATEKSVQKLCTEGHSNYLVEFADAVAEKEGYSIAIWDATSSKISYYRKGNSGSYILVKSQITDSEQSAIKSGTYIIQSQLKNGMVVDVNAGSRNNGANVQLYGYNATKAQTWKVDVDDKTGLAKIINVGSGKVLDVYAGLTHNGTNVWQYDDNGSLAQRWRIVSRGDGFMTVISALNGTSALDVYAGNSTNGANVQIWDSNNSSAQAFAFIPVNPSVSSDNQAELKDGYYSFAPAVNENSRLDLAGWSAHNGASLQIWSSTTRDNQVFKITKQQSGFYRIENVWSGKSLEVSNGSIIPGSRVQQWSESKGNKNQEWSIAKKTGGSYTIQNVASGLMLEVSSGSRSNGTPVQGYIENGTQAQRWFIAPTKLEHELLDDHAKATIGIIPNGTYAIRANVSSRSVLDVDNNSKSNGANVQLWESLGNDAQRWILTQDPDTGYYTITHKGTNKVLDVYAASTSNGANVQQWSTNNSLAQKWIIERDERGGYCILSALRANFALDLYAGGTTNGTNAQMYESNGTLAQSFSFISADNQVDACERGTVSELDTYMLVPSCAPNNAIDIPAGSKANGERVKTYRQNNSDAQKFRFIWQDGYYLIVNVGSGKALEVKGGDVVSGASVAQYTPNKNNPAQLFSIQKNDDGTLTFINKAGGLVLDVYAASAANGAEIDAYTSNSSAAQKFTLK